MSTFTITRSEDWGYVQNYVKYDKEALELTTYNQASSLEGGACKVNYKFTVKKDKDVKIKFIQDYSDFRYEFCYKYISKSKSVLYLGSKIKKSSKCLIS